MQRQRARERTNGERTTTSLRSMGIAVAAMLLATGTMGSALVGPAEDGIDGVACLKLGLYRAVWEIQGDGDTSPYEDTVQEDVRGIVTASFQKGEGGSYPPQGFFIQAHEPDCAATTSDGVFVHTGGAPRRVAPGDLVSIEGAKVVENVGIESFYWEHTRTELRCGGGCGVEILRRGLKLPDALEYTPPQEEAAAHAYNEAREGMLVRVTEDATVVAAVNKYDEFSVLRGLGQDRLHQEDEGDNGHVIHVEGDAVWWRNCGRNGFGDVVTFDAVPYEPENGFMLYGPLTYSFNTYKIQQDDDAACVRVEPGDRSSFDPRANPPPSADADPALLTVASLNAYNYFDTEDDPLKLDELTTPSASTYTRRTNKLANTVCDPLGLDRPLIVALQEVENAAVLERLVGRILDVCGVDYDYVTRGAPDDRGIETSFMWRADRVAVESFTPRQGCSAVDRAVTYEIGDGPSDVVCGGATPFYLHGRPPIELVAKVTLAGKEERVIVYTNHFKSKHTSSVCSTPDCTDWRIEEAQWLLSVVQERLREDPGAYLVVTGDLNDHFDSEPLRILRDGGLVNLWYDLQGPPTTGQGSIGRYSYVYQGVAQSLDHHLASPALAALPHVVSPRHINVDWPGDEEYNHGMYRVSDHDPLLVAYRFA